jgi:hypothetical protein
MNPMVPMLTGWLVGSVDKASTRQGGVMKIVLIEPDGLDSFIVEFASGLVVRVQVSEVPAEASAGKGPVMGGGPRR